MNAAFVAPTLGAIWCEGGMAQLKEDSVGAKVTWRRVEIGGAGITIDQYPEWPALDGERLVYQRFSNDGTVSIRWGRDATIDDVIAHVGLGSSGSIRTIEEDRETTVDDAPARRIRFRVVAPAASAAAMGAPPLSDHAFIYVFVSFDVKGTPVLTSYRAPASELAAVAPLLEHILASVHRR